jgi:hypothetical protein
MNKLIAKLIYFFLPSYFDNKTSEELNKWQIADVYNGKIYFNEKVDDEKQNI